MNVNQVLTHAGQCLASRWAYIWANVWAHYWSDLNGI